MPLLNLFVARRDIQLPMWVNCKHEICERALMNERRDKLELIWLKSRTDIGTASRAELLSFAELHKEKELPIRVNLRTLALLPILVNSRTDAQPLNLPKLRRENELPTALSYMIERFSSEPPLHDWYTEKLELMRMKYLIDSSDPV
jgi:hypothetical protein